MNIVSSLFKMYRCFWVQLSVMRAFIGKDYMFNRNSGVTSFKWTVHAYVTYRNWGNRTAQGLRVLIVVNYVWVQC